MSFGPGQDFGERIIAFHFSRFSMRQLTRRDVDFARSIPRLDFQNNAGAGSAMQQQHVDRVQDVQRSAPFQFLPRTQQCLDSCTESCQLEWFFQELQSTE